MDKNSCAKASPQVKFTCAKGLTFPKSGRKRRRKKHQKSILQQKEDRHCFLCLLEGNEKTYDVLHEHHIFYGMANRKKSEEYGLKVNLCVEHHETGKFAVHRNREEDMKLKKIAQEKFEETHTREEFQEIFGKSYL